MNDSNILKEIGRSYIVSSLLPSSLFLPIGILLFYGFIPKKLIDILNNNAPLFGQNWLITLAAIFWVGFLLHSSFETILDFFQGSWIPQSLSNKMKNRFIDQYFNKHLCKYTNANEIKNKGKSSENISEFSGLHIPAINELVDNGLKCPLNSHDLFPTRLGNVFQSNRLYIEDRYNIKGEVVWPRLIHIFPSSFLKNLEEKHNYLMFLLNSSFLSFIYGTICIIIGVIRLPCLFIYQLACHYPGSTPSIFSKGFNLISPLNYVLIGIFLFASAYILYRVSVNAAEDYCFIVCAGFDLYRYDLLQSLGVIPKDIKSEMLSDERIFWQKICEFLIGGPNFGFEEIDFEIWNNKYSEQGSKGQLESQK